MQDRETPVSPHAVSASAIFRAPGENKGENKSKQVVAAAAACLMASHLANVP